MGRNVFEMMQDIDAYWSIDNFRKNQQLPYEQKLVLAKARAAGGKSR